MVDKIKKDFYGNLERKGPSALFEHLGDHYYFVKDKKGGFVACSKNLAQLLGFNHEDEIVGKDELDFFTFDIAMQIKNDDKQVFEEGKSIINRIEFIDNKTNLHQWVCTCKVPLYDKKGNVTGLEGYIHPIIHDEKNPCMVLKKALDEIHGNFKNKFELEKLASLANMSASSLERNFKKYFHMTPFQYIQKIRIDKACIMLQNLDKDIVEVAFDTGFCDQSHFTKVFRVQMGMTPHQYRDKYRVWL